MSRGTLAFVLGLVVAGCAHNRPPMGRLRITCFVGDPSSPRRDTTSRVSIDGVFVGPCEAWPDMVREVRAGPHVVEIKAPWPGPPDRQEVDVPEDEEITVETRYNPTPD